MQTTAEALTKSSPVATTQNLALWLESSSGESLLPNEKNDGNALTVWNDINPSANKAIINVGATNPTYANTINRIPAVRFSGNNNSYFTTDGKFLNGSDYTIMILEQREANNANNYFIGDSSINASNQNLLLGYSQEGTLIHSQAGTTASNNTNSYAVSVPSYSTNSPKLFIFTNSASGGKKTYVNGMLMASSSNTSTISNLSNLYIGKGYNGQIGELAIFNRKLADDELSELTKYITKKWSIKTTPQGSSCVGGSLDSSGNCLNTCPVSVTGSSTSIVNPGSGTIACNQTGYSGSVSYNCTNGTFTPTSSCVAITCSAAAGTGYNAKSGLAYAASGSGSFACDATGYTGTVNYTCTTTGAATVTGSCSLQTCTISGAGFNTRIVNYGDSGSITCSSGYFGGVNYTCNAGGGYSTTGSCATCSGAGGYSLLGACWFTSPTNGWTCNQTCTYFGLTFDAAGSKHTTVDWSNYVARLFFPTFHYGYNAYSVEVSCAVTQYSYGANNTMPDGDTVYNTSCVVHCACR